MNIKKLLLAVAVSFMGSGLLVSGLIASEEFSEEMESIETPVTRYPQSVGSGGERAAARKRTRTAADSGSRVRRKTGAVYRGRRLVKGSRTMPRRGAIRTTASRMPEITEEVESKDLNSLVPEALMLMNEKLEKEGHDPKMANSFILALRATDFALDSLLNNANSSDEKEWEVVETNFANMLKAWNTYQPTVRVALGFKETRDLKHRRYDRAEAMKKIAELGQRIAKAMQSNNQADAASLFQKFVEAWEARRGDLSFSIEMGYGYEKALSAYSVFAEANSMTAETEEE